MGDIVLGQIGSLKGGSPSVWVNGVLTAEVVVPYSIPLNLLSEGDWVLLARPEGSGRWIVIADLTGDKPQRQEGGGGSRPIMSGSQLVFNPGATVTTEAWLVNAGSASPTEWRFDPGFPVGTMVFPVRGPVGSGSTRLTPPIIVGTSLRMTTVRVLLRGGTVSGLDLIVDIHKNGTSIFAYNATLGVDSRPKIVVGGSSVTVTPDPYRRAWDPNLVPPAWVRVGDTVDLAQDDYLDCYLDQGSVASGVDMTVVVRVHP